MIQLSFKDMRPPLYCDGNNVRDWLYVHDHFWTIDLILFLQFGVEEYKIILHERVENFIKVEYME